ncbi:MAG: adenylate/guanylate cyclase domain-containing protein [Proteobacteria bacterium]|nr:adenylate/guanylate cyclase domain-containing protein [Pseudomonadota bacterium]MBU1739264.1 adenylate/guanylate cyclase domain-containing protein [Pseudomonadota bacterium]
MSDSSEQAVLQELDTSKSPKNIWNLKGKNTFKIGRGPGNDIILPYSWVSRKHTLVQQEKNGIFHIMDLGSSNGTYLNNKRIYSPAILNNGDAITLGKTKLKFVQFLEQREYVEEEDVTLDMTVAYIQKEMVTILVCDLRDFTSLSESMGNQIVSKLLQFWTKKVGAIINEHDGLVDKFIGDAVMATWIGGDIDKGIRHAIEAAMEISVYTRKMGENIPEMPKELAIGAAINTGEAMMGNMGVDSHRDSTVIGDVVNVAFRLEANTIRNELDILLGEGTAQHLKDLQGYFTRRSFDLKGKKEKINAYGCNFKKLHEYLTSGVK